MIRPDVRRILVDLCVNCPERVKPIQLLECVGLIREGIPREVVLEVLNIASLDDTSPRMHWEMLGSPRSPMSAELLHMTYAQFVVTK